MDRKGAFFVLATLIILAVAILPNCQLAQAPQGPAVLKLGWYETDPKAVAFINNVVPEYKAKTGVDVQPEVIASTELWPKLQANIGAGRAWDITQIGFMGFVRILIDQGQVEPLDDIIAKYGKDDFLPGIIPEYNGHVWWYPYDYNPGFLYVRTDLLRAKGIDLPVSPTWDQLLAAAKALKEGDRYGIALCMGEKECNGLLWSPLLWGNGVQLYDKDWNVILDSPEIKPKAVEALNYWKELYQYMPPGLETSTYADMLSLFATGRVGIGTYAGRMVHYMKDNSPDLLDKYKIIGFPTKDGKKPAVGFGYDLFIVPKGPNSAAAKEFLAWFAENKTAELDAVLAAHYVPTQKSIYNNPKYRDSADAKQFWDTAIQPQYNLLNNSILV